MTTAQLGVLCGLIGLLITVMTVVARALSKWSKNSEIFSSAITLQGVKHQASAAQFEAAVRLQGEQMRTAAAELRLETQAAVRTANDAAEAAAAATAAACEATAKAETAGTKWNAELVEEWRAVRSKVDDIHRQSQGWLELRRDIDEARASLTEHELRLHDLERDHQRNHPADRGVSGRVTAPVIREASGRFILREPELVRPTTEEVRLPDEDEENKR
jgi:hypothetical protein